MLQVRPLGRACFPYQTAQRARGWHSTQWPTAWNSEGTNFRSDAEREWRMKFVGGWLGELNTRFSQP